MPTFLFKGGRVWDGEKFENKNVYVENGKIAYMGSDEPAADYSYDITGKILSAGFVDIHTHLKHVSTDNFGFEPHLLTVPFGVTCADDNFESIREAQNRGVIIDAGMAGCIHTDFTIFETAIKNNLIPDVISTDITKNSAYIRGGIYGLTMCMSIAKDLGMAEEDVFKCVTSNAAKAVGKEAELGTLKIGGCADLTVVDYEGSGYDTTDKAGRRITNDKSLRCVLTMINGYIQYRI